MSGLVTSVTNALFQFGEALYKTHQQLTASHQAPSILAAAENITGQCFGIFSNEITKQFDLLPPNQSERTIHEQYVLIKEIVNKALYQFCNSSSTEGTLPITISWSGTKEEGTVVSLFVTFAILFNRERKVADDLFLVKPRVLLVETRHSTRPPLSSTDRGLWVKAN